MKSLSSTQESFFVLAFLLLLLGQEVRPAVRFYDFTVKYFTGAPDGVTRQILGVNGKFPGPTIRAKIGDLLVVSVKNLIQTRENTSIHWHGLEQVLTPFQDGPEQVTQCPIVYGATQIYSFELKQSGTYWWHSHHGPQYVEGYWGALIIENKPEIYRSAYNYNELTFTVNDWYHKPAAELTDWYLSPASQGHEPIPNSVLLNGRGSYPCVVARKDGYKCSARWQTTNSPQTFTVDQYKTYRIRIINTSAMTPFYFSIDGHKLETIEVDGVDTVRVAPVDVVRLSAAMRYSFLVRMNSNSPSKLFWIRAKAFTIPFTPNPNSNPYYPDGFEPEVKAILKYSTSFGGNETQMETTTELAGEVEIPIIHPLSSVKSILDSEDKNVTPPGLKPPERPKPPPEYTGSGMQGRPETHGINWNNLAEVLELVAITNNNNNIGELNLTSLARADDSHQNLGSNSRLAPDGYIDSSLTPSQDDALSTRAAKILPQTQPTTPAISLNPNDCRPYPGNRLAPASFDEQVTLNVEFFIDGTGIKRGAINGIVYKIGTKPVIFNVIGNEPIPSFVNPIKTNLGNVIQIVINNRNDGGHPFHLHGHTFWVVGTGSGGDNDYDEGRDGGKLRRDGVRRDTTSVPPRSWAVIRYIADNPGTWLFHCHINWHLQVGLGAVLIEGEDTCRIIYHNVPVASRDICEKAGISIS